MSDNNHSDGFARRGARLSILALVIIAGVGLIALFVYALSPGPAVPAPVGSDFPGAASPPTQAPVASETVPITQVVADINGRIVTLETVQTMAHVDQAMSDLFGAPSTPDLLDRAVNGELVWQAAQAAGEPAAAPVSDADLAAWLNQAGRSQAELAAALDAHGIDLDAFRVYFARLQLVERFSARQAAGLGIGPEEYVRRLQRQAQISFGPAAAGLANQAQAVSTAAPSGDPGAQTVAAPQVSVTTSGAPAAPPVEVGPHEGLLAPPFELPALGSAGPSLSLAALNGKPAALTFFATWCPYCRRQTPLLVEAARKYAGSVQFVGIDVGENEAQAQGYIKEMGISYPVALDDASQVGGLYAVTGFPTTFFIDAQGEIVRVQVGLMSAEDLEAQLQQLLTSSDIEN